MLTYEESANPTEALFKGQGQNMALTALCVPYSLDSGKGVETSVSAYPEGPTVGTPPRRHRAVPTETRTDTTRWSTTLSLKVNLPHAINFRAVGGANLVTYHPRMLGQRNPRAPPSGLVARRWRSRTERAADGILVD